MEVLESLHGNVVCALAAGIGDYVRCTLLEYSYHDGQFWIFTEGGEKFIGLERNKNVSLAVFEKPPDFGALKSVLVMGTAKLIEPMLFEVPGFDKKFDDRSSKDFFRERICCGNAGNTV